MRTLFNWTRLITQQPDELHQHQTDLQSACVQESQVKLSHQEEAVIEEETFRILIQRKRLEKLARRKGQPLPPAPGSITYAVYG